MFFSDRNGRKIASTEIVCNDAWLGIVASIKKCIREDALSHDFPLDCPDGNGICGFDENMFRELLRSVIPNMNYTFPSIGQDDPFEDASTREERIKEEQYAVIDTIEFVYAHLQDAVKAPKKYHEYFHHYELMFNDGTNAKNSFRQSVNDIFRRNGIMLELKEDGTIIRISNSGMADILAMVPEIQEPTVQELLYTAISKYQNPKIEERKIALEKLWDAFERIKTTYRPDLNKKASVTELLKAISPEESFRQELDAECNALTTIGNSYQIRHHEVDKKPITTNEMLDYWFARMLSMVNILLSVFPKYA